jgi:hypothetical protein
MNQPNAALKSVPDVDKQHEMKSNDARHSKGPVTAVITPRDTDIDTVRQELPNGEYILEKSPSPFESSENWVTERFRCTFPTIAEARESCRGLAERAVIRLEAPITLHEEELEVLAKYHAHQVLSSEDFLSFAFDKRASADFYYHNGRLHNIGTVFGEQAVQKVFEETREKQRKQAAAGEEARAEVEMLRRCVRSLPRRVRSSNGRASARTKRTPPSGRVTNTKP